MDKKRALVSVSDKTGLIDFCRDLAGLGWEIVSTGGTAQVLKDAGIKVILVSQVTFFPEILDGRVKTLHPAVHGGILAKDIPVHREQLEEHGIIPFGLVVVNLYPFAETVAKPGVKLDEVLENIDIGGPAMVRAAAKNYSRVTVVIRPEHYPMVIRELKEKGETAAATRQFLAGEAFSHTAAYDAMVSAYLTGLKPAGAKTTAPFYYTVAGVKKNSLRYGENPQQQAAFYQFPGPAAGLAGAVQHQGKELSYNNLIDTQAALDVVNEFGVPAAVVIKHSNPCGTATGETLLEAYQRALEADPVSAYGGIVALNRIVDDETALALTETFLEVIVAPGFRPEALELLRKRTNLRVLEIDINNSFRSAEQIKVVDGGFLVQDSDREPVDTNSWRVVSKTQPDSEQWQDLLFTWQVVRHVKSNAIVVGRNCQTLGVGAGQMNRVGAAEIALRQAGKKAQGAVLASDAFFPFRDVVDLAAQYGITAIVETGGSKRDEESIQAADEHGIVLVFTGLRHFKH